MVSNLTTIERYILYAAVHVSLTQAVANHDYLYAQVLRAPDGATASALISLLASGHLKAFQGPSTRDIDFQITSAAVSSGTDQQNGMHRKQHARLAVVLQWLLRSQSAPAATGSAIEAPEAQSANLEHSQHERMEFVAADMYAAVRPQGDEVAYDRPIPELQPTLRPYQNRALAWMVSRECAAEVIATLSYTIHHTPLPTDTLIHGSKHTQN